MKVVLLAHGGLDSQLHRRRIHGLFARMTLFRDGEALYKKTNRMSLICIFSKSCPKGLEATRTFKANFETFYFGCLEQTVFVESIQRAMQ